MDSNTWIYVSMGILFVIAFILIVMRVVRRRIHRAVIEQVNADVQRGDNYHRFRNNQSGWVQPNNDISYQEDYFQNSNSHFVQPNN